MGSAYWPRPTVVALASDDCLLLLTRLRALVRLPNLYASTREHRTGETPYGTVTAMSPPSG